MPFKLTSIKTHCALLGDGRSGRPASICMAADRAALLQLKQGLRQRLQAAPAWDVEAYTRDFERALRAMWEDHCAKA
jgi:hypothetical protein